MPVAILIALRPRQWAKNLLIFGGLVFGQQFTNAAATRTSFLAFGLFCGLSSGVYLLNDVMDKERDAAHPEKRRRPIASGDLPVMAAIVLAAILISICLVFAFQIELRFGVVGVAYIALQAAYTLGLKNVVLLDVFLIATGFVLRALAGAVVLRVQFSPWLFLCTLVLALFLGFGKRRHELNLLGAASAHRPSLSAYTTGLLDQAVGLSATSSVLSYALYTIDSSTGRNNPYLMFTIPFVLYGVLRYLYHIYSNQESGSPDRILFTDIHIGLTVVLWMASCILALKFGAGGAR